MGIGFPSEGQDRAITNEAKAFIVIDTILKPSFGGEDNGMRAGRGTE